MKCRIIKRLGRRGQTLYEPQYKDGLFFWGSFYARETYYTPEYIIAFSTYDRAVNFLELKMNDLVKKSVRKLKDSKK